MLYRKVMDSGFFSSSLVMLLNTALPSLRGMAALISVKVLSTSVRSTTVLKSFCASLGPREMHSYCFNKLPPERNNWKKFPQIPNTFWTHCHTRDILNSSEDLSHNRHLRQMRFYQVQRIDPSIHYLYPLILAEYNLTSHNICILSRKHSLEMSCEQ